MKETFEKDHINARIKNLNSAGKRSHALGDIRKTQQADCLGNWVLSKRPSRFIAARIMQKTGADSVAELVRMTEKNRNFYR